MISITLKNGTLILNLAAIASIEQIGIAPNLMFTIYLVNGISYTISGADVTAVKSALSGLNAVFQPPKV